MAQDLEKLKEMKARLNRTSPSFCMAKWMHTTLHLLNGQTHSCHLPPTHKIPAHLLKDNPSALHNTPEKKQQRKMMKSGQRPEGCSTCWKVEDLPGEQASDRHLNALDSWIVPYFDKVEALEWDEDVNPSYAEVSFSSICNFKCSYCAPHVSSAWANEIRSRGVYKLSQGTYHDFKHVPMPFDEDEENPYIDAFWRWLPDLYKDLTHLRVTGGEPLLSKHTFKLMDWVKEHPHPDLDFSVNSNLGVPQKYLDRFFTELQLIMERKSIASFKIHTSVDTYGVQAEYIRNGLKFKEFEKNINRYLREFPEASLGFMCTFNSLSPVGFQNFLRWALDLRQKHFGRPGHIFLDIPHLVGPAFMNIRTLPERYGAYVESCIDFMVENQGLEGTPGFRQKEIAKMRRILETMKDRPEDQWMKTARKDFYLFFTEHDRRRGTNFLKTFPEMEDYWGLCRQLV